MSSLLMDSWRDWIDLFLFLMDYQKLLTSEMNPYQTIGTDLRISSEILQKKKIKREFNFEVYAETSTRHRSQNEAQDLSIFLMRI